MSSNAIRYIHFHIKKCIILVCCGALNLKQIIHTLKVGVLVLNSVLLAQGRCKSKSYTTWICPAFLWGKTLGHVTGFSSRAHCPRQRCFIVYTFWKQGRNPLINLPSRAGPSPNRKGTGNMCSRVVKFYLIYFLIISYSHFVDPFLLSQTNNNLEKFMITLYWQRLEAKQQNSSWQGQSDGIHIITPPHIARGLPPHMRNFQWVKDWSEQLGQRVPSWENTCSTAWPVRDMQVYISMLRFTSVILTITYVTLWHV